jgi:arsenite methyltransferase
MAARKYAAAREGEMNTTTGEGPVQRAGRYGIDAPLMPLLGAVFAAGNLISALVSHQLAPLLAALMLGLVTGCYLHTTLYGKFAVWAELLDELGLRGDERILDLGCGRGAVLCMAAARVPRGRVTGIDIWSTADQSGNAEAMTRRNAADEGVAERIELHTGDMRKLPFADASFDLVLSNMAIHNIREKTGRDQAVGEALRVLRPGGRLLIADILHTRQYRWRLATAGATAASRRGLGWRMWWSGPWLPTAVVRARRPG